jgi:hypothetical protein
MVFLSCVALDGLVDFGFDPLLEVVVAVLCGISFFALPALGADFFLEVDLIRLFFPMNNPFKTALIYAYNGPFKDASYL